MRLVQVMVPAGKREAVIGVLDEEGIDYVITDETSGRDYTAVVSFPLPTAAVEDVLTKLREIGLGRDAYTVVLEARTVVSGRFDALKEQYESENKEEDLIAREELVSQADELAPRWRTFVVMTVMSAIVATSGLLLDSPAVVVGSMVIAPLIGPAMATSVGTVVADRELFVRGAKLQIVGGALAIGAAAVFAASMRWANVVPLGASEVFALGEVNERLSPDVLSLAVAMGAGVAGALSLSSGVSAAMVGVMIAAALVPPTAVVGIGIAWGHPVAVLGSFVLVLVNFLSINLMALAVFWYKGYRPKQWFHRDRARTSTYSRIGALVLAILVLSAFLGAVTLDSYRTATYKDRAETTVEDYLDSRNSLELISIEVTYGEAVIFTQPRYVSVVVGYPPGTDPPLLAELFSERLTALVDEVYIFESVGASPDRVAVEVRYLPTDDFPANAA